MRRPRSLSREDRELWQRVASRTEPLHSRAPAPAPAHVTVGKIASAPSEKTPISSFQIGSKAGFLPPQPRSPEVPVRMDHKTWRRMKAGKLAPEARLDLHGMTLQQAHARLNSFIEISAAQGRRLVLVITGKGRPGPDSSPLPSRSGVLRRQVPHWLGAMPVVLQVSAANRKHGGEGALYVYLRRQRC